jgi:hypothetical protein
VSFGQRGKPPRRGTRAPLAGLAASLAFHLLLLLWNPVLHEPPDDSPFQRAPPAAWRVAPLQPVPSERADPGAAAAVVTTPSAGPIAPRRAESRDTGVVGVGPVPDRAPRLGERLSYRPGQVWVPSSPRYETFDECRQRELAERLDSLARDPSYGRVPASPSQPAGGGGGIGIRIPFGRKPPPPPDPGVAPPLPDSLRLVTRPPPPGVATLRRAPGCRDTIPPTLPRRQE